MRSDFAAQLEFRFEPLAAYLMVYPGIRVCEMPISFINAIDRKHAVKKANGRRLLNDYPRLDQNIPLEDQRASLVTELITEAGALNILSLREQIRLLDARKAGDEFLAWDVPNP